jgi:hypothetical protein
MATVLKRLVKHNLGLLLCTMNSNSARITVIWLLHNAGTYVSQHAAFIFGMTDLQNRQILKLGETT